MQATGVRVLLSAGIALSAGLANAELLVPYSTEPVCDDKGECFTPWVSGYEGFFCEPLNGYHDWLLLGEGIGSLWTLMDCTTGETLDVVVYERPNIDLMDEVIDYRKQINSSPARENIREISDHMKSLSTRVEIREEFVEPARLKQFCALAVPTDVECF